MPSNVVGVLRPFPAGFAKGAYRTAPGMRAPALQHSAKPRFPPEASGCCSGVVEVLAVIDEDGDVNARVLAAPAPREPFEREALACVRKYVFEPGSIDGRPVPVVVTLLVDFHSSSPSPRPARVIGGTTDPRPGIPTRLAAAAEPASPHLLRPLPVAKVYPELGPDYRSVSGRVEMLVAITAAGVVDDVEVTRGLAPEIDDASMECVRQWLFEPAFKSGRPVPVFFSAFVSVNELET